MVGPPRKSRHTHVSLSHINVEFRIMKYHPRGPYSPQSFLGLGKVAIVPGGVSPGQVARFFTYLLDGYADGLWRVVWTALYGACLEIDSNHLSTNP